MSSALVIAGAVSLSACGKKGPPLAPIAHVPAAVDQIAARRIGHDVYVTLTVPGKNIDATVPADVRRVDIYAVTALAPPARGRFLESADLIASIPVARVPERNAKNPPPVPVDDGTAQAMPVTIRETLRPDHLTPKPAPAPAPVRARARPEVPDLAASAPGLPERLGGVPPGLPERLGGVPQAPLAFPHRYYMALAFSERGRPGPPGAVVDLPLMQVPDAPEQLLVTYDAAGVTLVWPASGGIIGFLMNRALPQEPAPFDEAPLAVVATPAAAAAAPASDVVEGPTRYNIYRQLAPDPLALPGSAADDGAAGNGASAANRWSVLAPLPLTPAPLDALAFADPAIEFDRERCYEVRSVRGAAPQTVEGDPSPRMCLTPIDIFPPAAPSGLTAVAADGVISLLWEPNIEPDVGGYVVLRGKAGDATLVQLTDTPIAEPRFSDKTVMPGVRYVYAVRAVDARVPVPNVSDESARVEETAR